MIYTTVHQVLAQGNYVLAVSEGIFGGIQTENSDQRTVVSILLNKGGILTMQTADYLKILKDEIHSAVFATIDENGLPDARVIDIMLVDSDSLYFITAKGKGFYRQFMEQKFAAVSGMTDGKDSLDKKAVSVRGKIRNIGKKKLEEVFVRNPYMNEIYPSVESRNALEVFQMYEGQGEYFDLSVKPIYRDPFYL